MVEVLATWSPGTAAERGIPTDELSSWGESKNSWGVIITGNIHIEFDALDGIADMVSTPECAFEGGRFKKFKEVAAAAKADESLMIGQVTHPGRQVQARVNKTAISALDVQLEPKLGMTFGRPHAATEREIARAIQGFAHAAEYLHKADFGGIELHAANGYLLSQFLSRTMNDRTDKRRCKPDDARELCKALDDFGFDFVESSGGTYENLGYEYKKESTRRREGYILEWAKATTKSLGKDNKLRTYIVGGLRSVGAMVKALDVVAGISLGRPATVEPHLAIDIIEGRVQGALKAVEAVESDQGMTLVVAPAQISQISRNIEPLDASDVSVM
ncbi:hypothetical protein AB5N19_14332 [Seiridium cardinale]